MASIPKTKPIRLSLVGAETLLGRELEDVLKNRSDSPSITRYSASGEGNFADEGGEAIYREPLESHSLDGEEAIVVAGSSTGAEKAYHLVKKAGGNPLLIDCSGHLDLQPEARIVAPLLAGFRKDSGWLRVVAHPAATALAMTLSRLAPFAPLRSVITLFEPASERGKQGASELHQQTTSLLAFKPLEKTVFDAQLAFNMLAAYGFDAPEKLSSAEQRIERHVATLLSGLPVAVSIPMPSIRLVQAPVFHGYSFSAWIEFNRNIEVGPVEEALASEEIDVREAELDPPTNVGAAGQSGLSAGDIRVDRNNPRAVWIWIVADNLRLIADSVSKLISELKR